MEDNFVKENNSKEGAGAVTGALSVFSTSVEQDASGMMVTVSDS